jgi:ribosomal-protein-alanine N-acetyltransferase
MLELPVAGALIRPWRPGDAPSLARHADNRKVWINLRDAFPHPYTLADAERWLAWAAGQDPQTHFCIAVGDEAVGGIGYRLQDDVLRRSAEVGFWLGEAHWGRGIATAAVQAVSAHAFASHDLVRLYAHVYQWNIASMRVLEKAGYACEAQLRRAAVKDSKTIDLYVYARLRE